MSYRVNRDTKLSGDAEKVLPSLPRAIIIFISSCQSAATYETKRALSARPSDSCKQRYQSLLRRKVAQNNVRQKDTESL